MRAINHALTGAIIGLSVTEPVIALPAAFLSHYALDMIPHSGFKDRDSQNLRKNSFKYWLIIDAVLCAVLVAILALSQPMNWLQAAACAFLAALPDMFSFGRYLAARNNREYHPNWYSNFASRIQWFERPIGWVVEVAWFIGAIIVLVPLVH